MSRSALKDKESIHHSSSRSHSDHRSDKSNHHSVHSPRSKSLNSSDRNKSPHRSHSGDKKASKSNDSHIKEYNNPCVHGPNLYGNVLGPTVDEPILVGLAALLKLCDDSLVRNTHSEHEERLPHIEESIKKPPSIKNVSYSDTKHSESHSIEPSHHHSSKSIEKTPSSSHHDSKISKESKLIEGSKSIKESKSEEKNELTGTESEVEQFNTTPSIEQKEISEEKPSIIQEVPPNSLVSTNPTDHSNHASKSTTHSHDKVPSNNTIVSVSTSTATERSQTVNSAVSTMSTESKNSQTQSNSLKSTEFQTDDDNLNDRSSTQNESCNTDQQSSTHTDSSTDHDLSHLESSSLRSSLKNSSDTSSGSKQSSTSCTCSCPQKHSVPNLCPGKVGICKKTSTSCSSCCVRKHVKACCNCSTGRSTSTSENACKKQMSNESQGDVKVSEVRYAITKITKFCSYTTFEVMKSTKKQPKVMPKCLEGVFVLRNKKCN
ncbi:suppressor protein SRP40-like [Sitophilus oryzae]|uniref:Suppressor protein SRP40-like n=1 Tax=Sitophilus oryzae TaxID=7048 RepID=A0A6J2YI73_SITOR|nr:suppressor protein SRP40-like [Sitophilus oryzae]